MSNLLVQNIKHTNGTTAATVNSSGHVATDTIKGNASAGSISVVGEGGSNTTNLQQGLTKAWHNFDGEGTVATRDSYNVSGLTDNGTGDYRSGITTNFGNDDYSCQVCASSQDGHVGSIEREAYNTTSQMSSYIMTLGVGVDDANIVCIEGIGDLA